MSALKMIELQQARIQKAKDVLDDAETELRRILFPLIKAAGLGDPTRDAFISCTLNGKVYEVETGWSCRGNSYTKSYSLPVAIIEATDTAKAAEAHRVQKEQAQAAAKRASTLAQIAALQQSLGDAS